MSIKENLARLRELQALPLERKIGFTAARIAEFYKAMKGNVVVSFSGGKDSTVLLYLVRGLFPDVRAVFCDTGLEYPEIREFVRSFDNVDWVRPSMPFNQVIKKHGYPVISKDVAQRLHEYREHPEGYSACCFGLKDWNETDFKITEVNYKKYAYLINAPFKVSHKCCYEMKKKPLHSYQRRTGLMPFIATMAEESFRRQTSWTMYGCNVLTGKNPRSAPMSFWTEQDVLLYLKKMHIPIASVYGDIVQTVDRGGAYNDRVQANRMHVLHVRRPFRERTEPVPAHVLYSSQAVGLLHQPARFERGAGLHRRSLRAGTGSVL